MPPIVIISSLLLFAATALVVRAVAGSLLNRVTAKITADAALYQEWAKTLFLVRPPQEFQRMAAMVPVAVIGATALAWLLTGSIVLCLVVAAGAWMAPSIAYRVALEKRMEQFDEQLPDAIEVMVASVRAGRSLQQAIEEVAGKMSGPAGQEFGLIAREYFQGGLALEETLKRARRRINAESFTMMSSALIINISQGGDLLSILERISDSLRELLRLKKKIATETAEVRAQEKVILIMTPLFCGLVCLFDDDIPHLLFGTIVGQILLLIVAAIQVASVLWIRQIVRSTV
jgi:tight adherence protein B